MWMRRKAGLRSSPPPFFEHLRWAIADYCVQNGKLFCGRRRILRSFVGCAFRRKKCRHNIGHLLTGGRRRAVSERTCRQIGSDGGQPEVGVRIGPWNVSYWTGDRLAPIVSLKVDLTALQETKLAAHYTENVRAALRRDGYVFHPGHAVAVHRAGGRGDNCGVGYLASPGVAVTPIMPQGAAWRRLHAMARDHAVHVPPRIRLAVGLRIFSIYVPLQSNPACREIFC